MADASECPRSGLTVATGAMPRSTTSGMRVSRRVVVGDVEPVGAGVARLELEREADGGAGGLVGQLDRAGQRRAQLAVGEVGPQRRACDGRAPRRRGSTPGRGGGRPGRSRRRRRRPDRRPPTATRRRRRRPRRRCRPAADRAARRTRPSRRTGRGTGAESGAIRGEGIMSPLMQTLIDLFLHLDTHLPQVAARYGPWLYGLLFLIIFAETGLVVTPFLPGDSLLFAAGALAATIDPATAQHILRVELVARAAAGRRDPGRRRQLRGRPLHRAAGSSPPPTTRGLLHKLLNRKHLRAGARVLRDATAARPWCSAAGCRSCGRSCRSSPAPAR